jgi:uncharacterized protein YlzI (FlbEa/FlbD family)
MKKIKYCLCVKIDGKYEVLDGDEYINESYDEIKIQYDNLIELYNGHLYIVKETREVIEWI